MLAGFEALLNKCMCDQKYKKFITTVTETYLPPQWIERNPVGNTSPVIGNNMKYNTQQLTLYHSLELHKGKNPKHKFQADRCTQ